MFDGCVIGAKMDEDSVVDDVMVVVAVAGGCAVPTGANGDDFRGLFNNNGLFANLACVTNGLFPLLLLLLLLLLP